MVKRGFDVNPKRKFVADLFKKHNLYNDWIPTEKDYTYAMEYALKRKSFFPRIFGKTPYIKNADEMVIKIFKKT